MIDWRKFDWDAYKERTRSVLGSLLDDWHSDPKHVADDMIKEFSDKVHECVEELACKKTLGDFNFR